MCLAVSFSPSTHSRYVFFGRELITRLIIWQWGQNKGKQNKNPAAQCQKIKSEIKHIQLNFVCNFSQGKVGHHPLAKRWKVIPVACWAAINVTYSYSLPCHPAPQALFVADPRSFVFSKGCSGFFGARQHGNMVARWQGGPPKNMEE